MKSFLFMGALSMITLSSSNAAIVHTLLDTPLYYFTGAPFGDYARLSIDFDHDGTEDFLFLSGDSSLILYHQIGNRSFILSSPPPNIGGTIASILGGTSIDGSLGDASFRWYEGTPPPRSAPPEEAALYPPRHVFIGSQFNTGSSGHTRGKDGYIGLEFLIDGQAHYAWVHFDSSELQPIGNGDFFGVGGTITGWAWETVPGQAIIAGAIPEPSVITLAAISLAACFAHRKRYGNSST